MGVLIAMTEIVTRFGVRIWYRKKANQFGSLPIPTARDSDWRLPIGATRVIFKTSTVTGKEHWIFR
jgi:hypothetical protein